MEKHLLLSEAYRAFNARDVDAALALMCPDVDWPNGMEGGRVLGREAVRAYWLRQWKLFDPHVEPVRFEEEPDGRTTVHVRQVVKDPDGRLLLDRMVEHVYAFADGKIAAMEIRE